MEEIIKIVTNHGLSLAIAIVVLYGGIQIMNAYIKHLKNKLDNEEIEKDSFEKRYQVSNQINLLINRLMNETDADMVGVYEFHNGEGNLGGVPFVKITNTYEVCNDKILSVQKEMQNLPCSLFTNFIQRLVTEDYVFLDLNTHEEKDLGLAYDLQKQRGVSKSVCIIITDVNRKVIGFVGIFNCDENKNITYKEIKKLSGLAKDLGVILTLNKTE